MGALRGKPRDWAALAIVVAVALAGCGGSGAPSADRAKLAREISSQLQAGNAPAGLGACVSKQSLGLPTDQLRALANSGTNPPAATRQLAFRLVGTCIRQGKGIAAIHALITRAILTGSVRTLPTVFTNCIVAKANATTPAQLAQLISAYATENLAAAQTRARQVGLGIAARCFAAPGVMGALRPLFLAPVRSYLKTTSAVFRNCVVAKFEHIPATQLEQLALNPSTASARGEALGVHAARACIASGAKP